MDKKIFLEKFGSKQSVNTSEGLKVSLKGNRKLLPNNEFSDVISAYDQYMEERNACNTIRLTCQINTVCTNVLFNRISEIVKDEGSSAVTFLNYGVVSGETEPSQEAQNKVFSAVTFKPKDIEYWRSDNMNYLSMDNGIAGASPDTPLSELIENMSYSNYEKSMNTGLTHPTNAIRDTQLSSAACGFIYHCGLDFLNNHLLRSKNFKTICKLSDGAAETSSNIETGYTAFNTIADYMRDIKGNCVVEKIGFPVDSGIPGNMKTIALHMYIADEIDTYKEVIEHRLIDNKQNGWLGFYNRSKIKSYSNFFTGETMDIERPLMNYNGGDFVDMYPGHEYYSFIPMYNKFKNRIEKNWNYCVTYPCSSTTSGFEDIIESNNGLNSLKTIYFDETTRADNGSTQLVMYSVAKHGLSKGDYVNIYKTYEDENDNIISNKVLDNAEVIEVVDEFIFIVFNNGVQLSETWVNIENAEDEQETNTTVDEDDEEETHTITIGDKVYTRHPSIYSIYFDEDNNQYYVINNKYINLDPKAQNISYKKVVNDMECDYYVRIFSRIPNFRFASGDTSSEYQLSLKDDDGLTLIDKYNTYEYEFENDISRMAYAKNIYTDDIGQIVFTDDIDISNLKDNRGRPLTSIYLTVIKNNQGYKEWYGFDYKNSWDRKQITADTIEFSHCFGKISCGIDTSDESVNNTSINSIKKISNVGTSYGYDVSIINPGRVYENNNIMISDNEVSYKHDKFFYGDLCCYDYYNAIESAIDPIMHRFNTAQRESVESQSNMYFKTYKYDEINRDDFDTDSKFILDTFSKQLCNSKAEGYYYIPHYKIPIKSFGKLQYMLPDILDIRSIVSINGTVKRIHCLQNHYLTTGDKAMIYDVERRRYFFLNAISHEGTTDKVFYCEVLGEDGKEAASMIPDMTSGEDKSSYTLFKLDNMNIPSYATLLKDGTCRYIWRDVLNNGFNSKDEALEEYPFTNGAFYVNRRIDLYVRRQDPYSMYGLYSDDDIIGNETLIEDVDNYVKNENIEC